MVAPILLALLIAILTTSLTFFAQQGLETAVETASRTIMTGQSQTAGQTQAQFKQAACQALPPYMSCAGLIVDAQTATSLSTVNAAKPVITFDSNGQITNSWVYNVGGSGRIVILRLIYIWSLPRGPLGFSLNNISSSQQMLVATSVVKIEPY